MFYPVLCKMVQLLSFTISSLCLSQYAKIPNNDNQRATKQLCDIPSESPYYACLNMPRYQIMIIKELLNNYVTFLVNHPTMHVSICPDTK